MSEKNRTPEDFMRRAIELSRNGYPAPNPHVGSVVVRGGEIVGEGYHEYADALHGEMAALEAAGEAARGAEVYVTLEPCNHVGRTGACSVSLIEAGVKKVVYASPDPNPRAQGGAQRLREAGIEVQGGLLADEARAENIRFMRAMEMKRPYVVLKSAMSLDGRIALPTGESQWITGEEARLEAHKLRAEMGAVLVGLTTALKDNPRLTARIPGVVNQPMRIVLDPEGVLGPDTAMFNEPGPFLQIVERASSDYQVEIPMVEGRFDLHALLAKLWEWGHTGLLLEGGAVVHRTFLSAGLVDRLELFVAPKLLGDGPTWVSGLDLANLVDAPEFHIDHCRAIGRDIWITATPA